MAGRRRKRHNFSRIHAFSCGKASFNGEHSLIGGPGFSRIVYCNDPERVEASLINYGDNYVRTTKYTLVSFLPKSLFEQFRRVANFFFLLCAILAFFPVSPWDSPFSSVFPLVFVVGLTMAKEILEDWRRKKQDIEMNNRKVKVHHGGAFDSTKWKDLKVGDVVKVEKDEFFPADLILLSSSYDDSICYVETTNLDGETNLKLKQALEETSKFQEDSSF